MRPAAFTYRALTGADLAETYLAFMAGGPGAREVRLRTSKNGKPRTLPADGELWDLLERRWQAREYTRENGTTALSEYLFHAGDGRAIVDFRHSWTSACKRAGVPGRLFHDLRRTAVRDMIRAGVPQSVAMRISGHKTAAVFLRYDITSEDDKRDALRKTAAHRQAQAATPTVVPLAPARGFPLRNPHSSRTNGTERQQNAEGPSRGPWL